jgi:hypothetical protein
MGRFNLTVLESKYFPFQKPVTQYDKIIKVNNNSKVDNFLEDLPTLLEKLFHEPYASLIHYPAAPSVGGSSIPRRNMLLQTGTTRSKIGVIDVDSLVGEGETFEEQIDFIIERYFPVEWQQARKVIRASSSYYTKGQSKFHVFFELTTPIKHETWLAYVTEMFNHHDEAVLKNSGQLLFTSKPAGNLVNTEFKCLPFEGNTLTVDSKKYVAVKAHFEGGLQRLSDKVILKKRLTKKAMLERISSVDMSEDSYIKTFNIYSELLAEGYNPKDIAELSKVVGQLNSRKGKESYINQQLKGAETHLAKRCSDPYPVNPTEISGYMTLPELPESKPGDVKITFIKATTGSGKTFGMRKLRGSFLCLSPTKLLVGQNAEDFKATPYHSGYEGLDLTRPNRISMTIQSLHKLRCVAHRGFDYLFIDEAAQCLQAIALADDEAMKEITSVLEMLLQTCKYIVFADADLTTNTIEAYKMLLGDFNNVSEPNT